jgi:hypothetical protein
VLATRNGSSTTKPVPATHVAPVPHAPTAQGQAENLAAWLTRNSR